ncbi:MAG: hypothetical protein H0V24_10860 [Chloroflexia bacterium]|nr:hypothetical protein [Chloroflexia bacterium]
MSRATRTTFTEQIARLHAELTADGVAVNDMRRAQSLEHLYAGAFDAMAKPKRAISVEPLEGPIEPRPVSPVSPRDSRLRYFLDGAQRTFLALRCNTIPILATVAATAILKRDDEGRCNVVPGTLRLQHALIAPRRHPDPELQRMLKRIDRLGLAVLDPFEVDPQADEPDPESYNLTDYGYLVEKSYRAGRTIRERIELELLAEWSAGRIDTTSGDWLVVDGRLHQPSPRAIGLVKQFSDAYLSGAEAAMMLDLPPGYRTTAFFPSDKGRRGGPGPDARTLWYLRMWDAAGLDARYALVRVETGPTIRSTIEIDQLTSWLWAERTPRATRDARWATLLYPVHYLERILKRCLDADTQGWPRG